MLYCAVHPLLRKNSGPTSVKDDHEGCWGTANHDIGNAIKCGWGCLGMFKYGWGWQGIIVLIAVWVPSQSLLTAVAIVPDHCASIWCDWDQYTVYIHIHDVFTCPSSGRSYAKCHGVHISCLWQHHSLLLGARIFALLESKIFTLGNYWLRPFLKMIIYGWLFD